MKQTFKTQYIVPDIHDEIETFHHFLKSISPKSQIIQLGDFSFNLPDSLFSWIYFWNICDSKFPNIPDVKIIRGNHETGEFADFSTFDNQTIDFHFKVLKSKIPHFPFKKPTKSQLSKWLQKLPFKIEQGKNIFVHGWYNPKITNAQHLKLDFDNPHQNPLYSSFSIPKDGYVWGSPAKIYQFYLFFTSQNNLDPKDPKTLQLWKQNPHLWYFGYENIEAYNDALKKHNKIVFCGHWFNPLANGDLKPTQWSNLIMLDGGIGYQNLNINNLFIDPTQIKFNYAILEDGVIKEIVCASWNNFLKNFV